MEGRGSGGGGNVISSQPRGILGCWWVWGGGAGGCGQRRAGGVDGGGTHGAESGEIRRENAAGGSKGLTAPPVLVQVKGGVAFT